MSANPALSTLLAAHDQTCVCCRVGGVCPQRRQLSLRLGGGYGETVSLRLSCRRLLNLVADFMIGWHQGGQERHRLGEQKWRARLRRPP